jgi:multidrug efflux pump
MSLSSVSINRPVLATVFAIVILLFGVVGLTFLGIREFPSVDPPISQSVPLTRVRTRM